DAKAVLLSIDGRQQDEGGEEEKIRLMTTGKLFSIPDGFRIEYEETSPDSVQGCQVTMELYAQRVVMQREGELVTHMVFEKNQRFAGEYQTPFGTLEMGIYATDVQIHMTENGGNVRLSYQLDLQGQYSAMHWLDVQVQPQGVVG
ncbi:MAG: DUF1934 domain-containing protein, partial [Clostridia bacterium]